jgi:hypothetical protein
VEVSMEVIGAQLRIADHASKNIQAEYDRSA